MCIHASAIPCSASRLVRAVRVCGLACVAGTLCFATTNAAKPVLAIAAAELTSGRVHAIVEPAGSFTRWVSRTLGAAPAPPVAAVAVARLHAGPGLLAVLYANGQV